MTRTYTNGFRIIREGAPNVSTEIDCGDGLAIQMPGTGAGVEAALLEARERRRG